MLKPETKWLIYISLAGVAAVLIFGALVHGH
jgi:hypothetical protein